MPYLTDLFLFIFSNTLVFVNTWFFIKIFTFKKNIDFFLSFFLLFIAQIIAIELFLGFFGKLYASNILLCLLILLIFNFLTPRPRHPDPALAGEGSHSKVLLLAIAAFGGFFLFLVWNTFINPPLRCDALIYHLVFPVNWLKNGNLNNPLIAFGVGNPPAPTMSITYYPFNGELLFFWLMFPFKSAWLANIAQAPFYFISILAIYSILAKLGVKKDTCFLIGMLWALIPNIFKHMKEGAYIDIVCAAMFFMVINYLLALKEDYNKKNIALLGIASGIFIGLKSLNIFWLISLLPLLWHIIYTAGKKKEGILKNLILIAGLILIFSGYQFIKNFISTGNIFYPIRMAFFGKTLMPGFIGRLEYANLTYPFREFSVRKLLFGEGLGLQLFAFVLPGTFLPLFLTLFMKNKKYDPVKILLYFVPLCMLLLYFFYIKAYWARYLYAYLGAGLIAFAIFLSSFKQGQKYINIAGLLCILSSIPELARRKQLLISLFVSIGIFLLIIYFKKTSNRVSISNIYRRFKKLLPLAITILFLTMLFFNKKYEIEQYHRYCLFYQEKDVALGWKWLNDYCDNGKRIAYAGRPETYPLFGSRFKNDVFYVPVNDKPNMPHFHPDGNYRKGSNYDLWFKNLQKEKADFLFIYQLHDSLEFPIEEIWAKTHPENFDLIYNNPKIRIYTFLK